VAFLTVLEEGVVLYDIQWHWRCFLVSWDGDGGWSNKTKYIGEEKASGSIHGYCEILYPKASSGYVFSSKCKMGFGRFSVDTGGWIVYLELENQPGKGIT
jgi:hypothetical protein